MTSPPTHQHDNVYKPITGVTYLPPSFQIFGSTSSQTSSAIPTFTARPPSSVVSTFTTIRTTQSYVVGETNYPFVGSDSNIDSVTNILNPITTLTTTSATTRAPAVIVTSTTTPPPPPPVSASPLVQLHGQIASVTGPIFIKTVNVFQNFKQKLLLKKAAKLAAFS